ncbi:hypothetical protein TARUN_2147 [Trichoderma arundinaceum]|uniref:SnoaL-like domain-containing protein n=1 Tax=Trichoderma arundinaceum TaxID=490622 RepID=A0A395NV97_TRIAR|nr:hypothetical protein TARUN_2147 [Trichoderma arundinaceum]
MSAVSPFSSKEAFATAIEAAFNCSDSDFEAKILNLYTKDTIITVNRNRMTWNEFVSYVQAVRDRTASVEIKSQHLLRDGNMFSEKHVAYGLGKDGKKTGAEALVIGELNEDGKAIWMEEIAVMLSDEEANPPKAT